VFNPHQKRDEDGKFAGGGYVGRRRAASSVERARRSLAPKQAKSRTAAARSAQGKKTTVGTADIAPHGTAKAKAALAKNDAKRQKLLSGELVIEPASPKMRKLYGRAFPPEVAVREYADPKVALAQVMHGRNLRQARSSKPAVARKQKAGRIVATLPENRASTDRKGRRKPVFPKQASARAARA